MGESYPCGDYDHCDGCCNCDDQGDEDSGYARDYYRDPVGIFLADSPKDRKSHRSRRLAGLEIEFNDARDYARLGQWRNQWKAGWHSDGSCGEELVTAPMAGDHIERCMANLSAAMREAGARIDSSCGLHVHVDGGDLFWSDIERLVKVYAHIEPALYMIGGQDRASSRWCVPLGRRNAKRLAGAEDLRGTIQAIAYGTANATAARVYVQNNNPGKKYGARYQGLNLCPWLSQRRRRDPKTLRPRYADATIEFRIHGNTSDMMRAAKWAQLLTAFVDWVSAATDADVSALPKSAVRALCKIVPSHATWIVAELKRWRTSTYKSRSIVDVNCRCDECRTAANIPRPAPTRRTARRTIGVAGGRYCFRLAA